MVFIHAWGVSNVCRCDMVDSGGSGWADGSWVSWGFVGWIILEVLFHGLGGRDNLLLLCGEVGDDKDWGWVVLTVGSIGGSTSMGMGGGVFRWDFT